MTIHAFKDANDGYYQVDVADGEPLPDWTNALTECDVIEPPAIATSITTQEELAAAVRADRNSRLASSDWTQLRDVPDSIAVAWQPYRQALREVTTQAGFPEAVTWPEVPA